MLADALRLQGRRTNRKWNICRALLITAVVVATATAFAHRTQIRQGLETFYYQHRYKDAAAWQSLPGAWSAAGRCGDALVFAGENGVWSMNLDGSQNWRLEITLQDPVMNCRGDGAVIYTPGGKDLVYTDGKAAKAITIPAGMDYAAALPEGGFAAVTAGSGCLAEIQFFDESGDLARTACLTDRAAVYLIAGSRGLMACCLNRNGIWTLEFPNETEIPLDAAVVLGVEPWNGGAALLTDRGILMYDHSGDAEGTLSLPPDQTILWDAGGTAAAAAYREGGWRLMTAEDPEDPGTPLPRKPLGLAVGERFIFVWDQEDIQVFRPDGTLCAVIPGEGAQSLLPIPGGAVLLGQDRFRIQFVSGSLG